MTIGVWRKGGNQVSKGVEQFCAGHIRKVLEIALPNQSDIEKTLLDPSSKTPTFACKNTMLSPLKAAGGW